MSNTIRSTLNLVVLGQSINVACPAGEIESLNKAAKLLENKLFDLRKAYPSLNMDKLVAMLALQIAHESLSSKQNEGYLHTQLVRYIEDLDRQIAKANEAISSTARVLEFQ
jgi:cell division protein ZapA (FtsZ GTPase activity inhibitor)